MKSNLPLIKLGLASAVAIAAMGMTGCGGSSSSNDAAAGGSGGGVECATTCTASGFVVPQGAIYVAADAADGTDITAAIITALAGVAENSVIVLPKGSFVVSASIVVADAQGITITGHGIDATNLDFSTAPEDDGFKILGGNDITIRDLGVYEVSKNGIKADGVNGIHMTYTAAVWEKDLELGGDENGAYGLYPVSSFNVLMENNYSKGSADAGIYVGQSENIVVRNNIAEHNVAGIEIENSKNADVYNNEAFDNSAGILSFDLPGLKKAYGGGVRIFSNNTYDNNTTNVGAGAVNLAPSGTGILIFATSDVEIYNNTITDNDTAGIEIASYFLADEQLEDEPAVEASEGVEAVPAKAGYAAKYGVTMADGWSPLIKNINMHDNTFTNNSLASQPLPGLLQEIIGGYMSEFNSKGAAQTPPAIIYGGIGELLSNAEKLTGFNQIVSPSAKADGIDYDVYAAADLICARDNVNNNTSADNDLNVGLVYGTVATDPANWNETFTAPEATLRIDLMANNTLLDCTLERLAPAVVTIKGTVYGCTTDDAELAACKL